MNILVPDMDDICLDNEANGLNWLFYLKGKYPKFKCTLFTIPGRSTFEWMDMLNSFDWIELAMHGWSHEEDEDITQEMLDKWKYAKIYKGPNWKLNHKEIELLANNGYMVAVKERLASPIKQWVLGADLMAHGHCWIESDWKRIEERITDKTEFKFVSETWKEGLS